MTPFVWMYIKTYEKLRKHIIENKGISTLIQMEYSAFEEATVPICAFVLTNDRSKKVGQYFDLSKFVGGMNVQKEKVLDAIHYPECTYFHDFDQDNYKRIDGSPIAFMASEKLLRIFETAEPLKKIAEPKVGLQTAKNDVFLRLWFECNYNKIGFGYRELSDTEEGIHKWFPYNKGGSFRRWYGNREYVIDWLFNGRAIRQNPGAVIRNPQFYLKPCITWSDITSAAFSGRYCEGGFLFDVKGSSGFPQMKNLYYVLGFLNSKISQKCIKILNPTISTQVGDMARIPVYFDENKKSEIDASVKKCIDCSRNDWDSFETSWDFQHHPLISGQQSVVSEQKTDHCTLISDHYKAWSQECDQRFNQLKANEEELNRIFIDIYGLQDELTPEVVDKDVTVRKADLGRDIRSFISYAVGCMFGRYSLDVDGLAYAGGEFSDQWVVVSGQYYKREVVEYYVGKELSRSIGMAESNVGSGGNISFDKTSSERGAVLVIGPDEKGGSVDSFQYRRGTSKKLYEGIRTISFNSQRVNSGTGNTIYDLCSPEILTAISNGNGNELVERGWKNAERVDWASVHCSLTTDCFSPDKDNIIPICDDEYFEDDIVGLFVEFVKTVYGADTLDENLKFIADALGGKGQPKDVIRNYFLSDFYSDHCKIYQKRPIYWLFDSGKKNGFKALIYMHRYQPDTIARIRTDYVHEQQARYRTAIADLEQRIANASTGERVKLNKKLTTLQAQDTEIRAYEEKIHHLADQMISIDLDDGVKKNYAIFQDVLAKIK